MEEFCVLILVAFFVTISLDKTESVQLEKLEELPLQTFDELFVDEWWDKDDAEDLKTPPSTNFGQNVHHQIDRQNTQIGQIKSISSDQLRQIEPKATDQNAAPLTKSDHSGQIEPNSPNQLGQIEPKATDQNAPPLTKSDHSGQIEPNSPNQLGQIEPNSTDQNAPPLTESDQFDNANSNENVAEDEQKRKIIDKFHEMKDKFKQKGKYSAKDWTKIEVKIAKQLKVNRKKIYKWKKEFGLSQKKPKNELIKKFDQRKAELKRAGFKNSQNELDKTVAKELGLSFTTIFAWKRELGQTEANKYAHDKQKEFLMKRYYEIKKNNPKNSNENIAKMLNIGRTTLIRWKRQFKRQQLHPNCVDAHSVEENAAANIQEIENSNSGSV